jgi:hypothetical protein
VPPSAGGRHGGGPPAGGWRTDETIFEAVTAKVPLLGDAAFPPDASPIPASSAYGALPAVSMPTGALAPASVPLPVESPASGFVAPGDGVIDMGAPPTAFARPPAVAPHASPPPTASGWEVVVAPQPPDPYGPPPAGRPTGAFPLLPADWADVAAQPAPLGPGDPYGPARPDWSVVVAADPVLTAGPAYADASPVVVTDATVLVGPDPGYPVAPGMAVAPGFFEPSYAPPTPQLPAGLPPQVPPASLSPQLLASVMAELATAAAAAAEQIGADPSLPGAAVGGPVPGMAPLAPYRSPRRVSPEDLSARYVVVREQVDYAMAEIALARAAFRRACAAEGPGWPFRDSEADVLRRPAVMHALACQLAGVERLRVWAQELYWLREQSQTF